MFPLNATRTAKGGLISLCHAVFVMRIGPSAATESMFLALYKVTERASPCPSGPTVQMKNTVKECKRLLLGQLSVV